MTLAEVESKISTLLAQSVPLDYKEGDLTVKGSAELIALMRLRESIINNPESDIEMVVFDVNQIDQFGDDQNEQVA